MEMWIDKVMRRVKERGLNARSASLHAGLSASYLQNFIKQKRAGINAKPRSEHLPQLAKALDVSVEWLLDDGTTDTTAVTTSVIAPPPQVALGPSVSDPSPVGISRARIPVYGQAIGGPGGEGRFALNGTTLDLVPAPDYLEKARNAYAVYVYGTSMEPKYRPGYLLFVDPNLPVRRGDDVIVQVEVEDGVREGYVKEFVSSGREIVLLQHNPPDGESKTIRIPAAGVTLHRVVGARYS